MLTVDARTHCLVWFSNPEDQILRDVYVYVQTSPEMTTASVSVYKPITWHAGVEQDNFQSRQSGMKPYFDMENFY